MRGIPLAGLGLEQLSPAEIRVLDHVLEGCSAREIADRLVLSEATVRSHLSRIYGKLQVSGQVELLARAARTTTTEAAGQPALSDTQSSAARWLPLAVTLVLLCAISLLFPPSALVVGPSLVLAGWFAGRAEEGTLVRAARPWLLVTGLAVVIWAAVFVAIMLASAPLVEDRPRLVG